MLWQYGMLWEYGELKYGVLELCQNMCYRNFGRCENMECCGNTGSLVNVGHCAVGTGHCYYWPL